MPIGRVGARIGSVGARWISGPTYLQDSHASLSYGNAALSSAGGAFAGYEATFTFNVEIAGYSGSVAEETFTGIITYGGVVVGHLTTVFVSVVASNSPQQGVLNSGVIQYAPGASLTAWIGPTWALGGSNQINIGSTISQIDTNPLMRVDFTVQATSGGGGGAAPAFTLYVNAPDTVAPGTTPTATATITQTSGSGTPWTLTGAWMYGTVTLGSWVAQSGGGTATVPITSNGGISSANAGRQLKAVFTLSWQGGSVPYTDYVTVSGAPPAGGGGTGGGGTGSGGATAPAFTLYVNAPDAVNVGDTPSATATVTQTAGSGTPWTLTGVWMYGTTTLGNWNTVSGNGNGSPTITSDGGIGSQNAGRLMKAVFTLSWSSGSVSYTANILVNKATAGTGTTPPSGTGFTLPKLTTTEWVLVGVGATGIVLIGATMAGRRRGNEEAAIEYDESGGVA